MNIKLWLFGLMHAALGGAAASVGAVIAVPSQFNLNTKAGWAHIGIVAATGALWPVVAYLQTPASAPDTPPIHRP